MVPAYNEERTLSAVLAALRRTEGVEELVVVSDGSTDSTAGIARAMGAHTVELRRNHGKGLAMAAGVASTAAPVILFVDGDITRLDPALLRQLIAPVLGGRLAMNVGIRHRGRWVDAVHRRTGPLLSGIRCLRREVFEALPAAFLEGYRVETALNWVCRRHGLPMGTVVFHGLHHTLKEEKHGLLAGAAQRVAMFAGVFAAYLRLRITDPVLTVRGPAPIASLRAEPEPPDL